MNLNNLSFQLCEWFSANITFILSPQVWTSWSFCRATRTRTSTRKPLTWLSVTSTPKTKTRLWLQPSTCSSSSSCSSSARPRWKASSYNAESPPHSLLRLHSFLSLCPLPRSRAWQRSAYPPSSLPIIREIDSVIIITIKKHYRSTCVRTSSVGRVLQSCQPVCEGFAFHSVLRWAHLCTWTHPTAVTSVPVPSFHLLESLLGSSLSLNPREF